MKLGFLVENAQENIHYPGREENARPQAYEG